MELVCTRRGTLRHPFERKAGNPHNIGGAQAAQMMLALVEHLETTDSPFPVYAYPDGDSLRLSLVPLLNGRMVPAVFIEAQPRYRGYESYRIWAPAKPPWDSTIGHAADVTVAIQMVQEGLRNLEQKQSRVDGDTTV